MKNPNSKIAIEIFSRYLFGNTFNPFEKCFLVAAILVL